MVIFTIDNHNEMYINICQAQTAAWLLSHSQVDPQLYLWLKLREGLVVPDMHSLLISV